jgi:uncharacterized membrane-anchored protein YhcB (DUF1043 family)
LALALAVFMFVGNIFIRTLLIPNQEKKILNLNGYAELDITSTEYEKYRQKRIKQLMDAANLIKPNKLDQDSNSELLSLTNYKERIFVNTSKNVIESYHEIDMKSLKENYYKTNKNT